MKSQTNIKTQKGNIEFDREELIESFKTIPTFHIKDNRLTQAEKGILTALFVLPNNWKITTRATAKYLNISENTFRKAVESFIKYGYLEVEHQKGNNYKYTLHAKSFEDLKFEPRNIKSYTIQQLIYFANSQTIETKYKNLIKKTLQPLIEFEKEIKEN